MKISDIRECVVLAETLNFTETARRLYTTQSALSKHIQAVENDLGVQLFVRNQQGVRITEAGKVFVENGKHLIERYDNTLISLGRLQAGIDCTLNVGCLMGAASFFLPDAINRFLKLHTNVDIQPITLEIDGILQGFESGRIDIGITTELVPLSNNRFNKMPLYHDYIRVIVPKRHRLAEKGRVSIKDLENEVILLPNATFMRRESMILDSILQGLKRRALIKENVNDIMSLFLLMQTKRYVTILFDHVKNFSGLGDGFEYLELEEMPQAFDVAAVWERSKENEIIIKLAQTMRETVQEKDGVNLLRVRLPQPCARR